MKKSTILFILIFPSWVIGATLEIIYDSGDTLPMDKYYGKSKIHIEKNKPVDKQSVLLFPIRTPSMSPGYFKPIEKHIAHFQTPLFIIGQDTLSKEWLIKRKPELIRLKAVGMIAEVDTKENLKAILSLTDGLDVYPASAEAIANQLDIQYYPALISKTGIEQ